MRTARVLWLAALGVLAGALALAWHFGGGARYRLYTNALAGDCWRAVEIATLSTSTIEPVAVAAPTRDAQGRAEVSIDYTMDRVLGGSTLNVRCVFEPGGETLAAVEFDGVALDAETLADVNRDLD